MDVYFLRIEPLPAVRPPPDDPPLREELALLDPDELTELPPLRLEPELRIVPDRDEEDERAAVGRRI